MARPRKKSVPLAALRSFETVKSELRKIREFDDYDIDTAVLVFKEFYVYKASTQSVKNAIERLKVYAEKEKAPEVFLRQHLADLMGVSRPTLNLWIRNKVFLVQDIPNFEVHKQKLVFHAEAARNMINSMQNYLDSQP